MRDDQQACLSRIDIESDLACALEQQLRHQRVISNWVAIFPYLAVRSSCDAAAQFKLARHYGLRDIAFTDEIRDDTNFSNRFRSEQKSRSAQTRLRLPTAAFHTNN